MKTVILYLGIDFDTFFASCKYIFGSLNIKPMESKAGIFFNRIITQEEYDALQDGQKFPDEMFIFNATDEILNSCLQESVNTIPILILKDYE